MNILTAREHQVLSLIIDGYSTKQIAAELGISFKTAACHRDHIMAKSGAANVADLVRRTLHAPPTHKDLTPNELLERALRSCRESQESRRMLRVELGQTERLRRQHLEVRTQFLESKAALFEKCTALVEASSRAGAA